MKAPRSAIRRSSALLLMVSLATISSGADAGDSGGDPPAAQPAPPPPAPSASATASAPPASGGAAPVKGSACEPGDLARIAEKSRRGMVRIISQTGWGAGFFIDESHIATHFEVVSSTRSLKVYAADGRSADADIVGVDAKKSVAILRLTEPLSGAPFELAAAPPLVGDDIVAVGAPRELGAAKDGALPTFRRGQISAVLEDMLVVDLPAMRSTGGPLLDCAGRVVGVLSGGLAFNDEIGDSAVQAVPLSRLREAQSKAGDQPIYSYRPVSFGLDFLFAAQAQKGLGLMGVSLGTSAIFAERIEFGVFVGGLGSVSRESDTPFFQSATSRLMVGAELGYRIPLFRAPASISIVPALGVALHRDETRTTTFGLAFDSPTCATPTAGCAAHATARDEKLTQTSALPFVGLTAHINVFDIGYQLRVDASHSGALVHQFTMGVGSF